MFLSFPLRRREKKITQRQQTIAVDSSRSQPMAHE
jgi:hypothetical protein